MAFVNELITDAEKEKLTAELPPKRGESTPKLWKWTVDRERGAFLLYVGCSGGGYEGTQETEHYVFGLQGKFVCFSGDPSIAKNPEGGKDLFWRIHRLIIPAVLWEKKCDVLRLIREALNAKGLLYRRDWVTSVHVKFDSSDVKGRG